MKKYKIIIFIIVITLISLLSKKFFFQKWLGYESIPNTFIFDEHDYPFVGYSFRKTGIPTGWSTMNAYQELNDLRKNNSSLNFNGISITNNQQTPNIFNKNLFDYPVTKVTDVDIGKGTETIRLVQPFFDHPIFGSWLFSLGIKNADSFDNIKPSDYRLVSLYLAVFTGILIFIFSYLLFKKLSISFIAFLIYSTVPEFILMSRFSLLENILIPLSLLTFSLILLSQKIKTKWNNLFLILAGVTSGLAFLTKESGVFIFITSIIFLIYKKANFKKIIIYTIPLLILSLIYYGYMYYLSPNLFFKLLFDQANREWFGPLSFFSQIIQPNFSGFPKSGYWLFGLISIFSLFIKNHKKYFYLFIPFICYLLIFLFMGGLNYPWYYLPFLPFLIVASAVSINNLFKKPNLANISLFYLLAFCSSFFWGYFVFHQTQNNYLVFRLSLILFVFLFILQKIFKKPITKFIWIVFIVLILFQMYNWNNQGLLYIISNWNHLPESFSFLI